MRRDVTREIRVAAGGTLAIRASLNRECRHARLSLWSKDEGDEDFSPFIPLPEILAVSSDGKPNTLKPIYFTLTEPKPSKEVKFTVNRDVVFKLVQDVDTADEPRPNVRIIHYGKAATRFLGRLRDAFRLVRHYSPPPVGG